MPATMVDTYVHCLIRLLYCLCSEPETALLLALTNSFRQHVWLNMHSGMEALFMPYDHIPNIPQGPGAQASLHILQQLNT